MNGEKKFHSPIGPAFAPGEQWTSSCGNQVTIVSTRKFGQDKWDILVEYVQRDGSTCEKGAWDFQVRYEHNADKNLRGKFL